MSWWSFKIGRLLSAVLVLINCTCVNCFSWPIWNSIKDATYCKFTECCNSYYVPYDIQHLERSLSQKMFGQPLVNELVNILSAHKASFDDTRRNRKAEVISLHGWTGVGKNYAATMVAEALFRKGMDSNYVLLLQGKKAIDSGDLATSRAVLFEKIKAVVRKCPKALIILDEVDDMDPAILDRMKSVLDHHNSVDGVDFRNAVFIFISNIAGQQITEELLDLYRQGVKREELELRHFEPLVRRTSFFEGGFDKSDIIAKHLIDHYIPFLPLEQQHVEECARETFKQHQATITDQMWEEALSVITYGPTESQPIFANNGCKRFTKHIPYIIMKHWKNRHFEL